MKLIVCVRCNELFNLSHTYKQCTGAHGGGQYVGDLNARIWGDQRDIVAIGFANSSFADAVRAQYQIGDLAKTFAYGGEMVSPGRPFNAFVMPDSTPSIKRVQTKAEYDAL